MTALTDVVNIDIFNLETVALSRSETLCDGDGGASMWTLLAKATRLTDFLSKHIIGDTSLPWTHRITDQHGKDAGIQSMQSMQSQHRPFVITVIHVDSGYFWISTYFWSWGSVPGRIAAWPAQLAHLRRVGGKKSVLAQRTASCHGTSWASLESYGPRALSSLLYSVACEARNPAWDQHGTTS